MKVTLKKPIQAHGQEFTELEFGDLTLGALDGIDIEISTSGSVKLDLGCIPKIVANLCEIPPSSAKNIALSDVLSIADQVQEMLGKFLPTGGS